jgi:serine/threonine protein kinase
MEPFIMFFLDISPNNILLSPTDLKSLISQLRAETQTSLRPSELSVGNLFGEDGFVFPDPTPVFRLSSTDNRGQFAFEPGLLFFSSLTYIAENHRRPDYMGGQALQSPEALLDAHCGTYTDMWALGCVVGMHFTPFGTALTD